MPIKNDSADDEILNWCQGVLGPFEILSDQSREHPGERAGAYRLRTLAGVCFIKIHRNRSHWESESHGYEQWASAFGPFAPRLLAVRDEEPLALAISELPGQILEDSRLSPDQERGVWRAAGQALPALHNLAAGETFGPCWRDGTCAGTPISDPVEYVTQEFGGWIERGARIDALRPDETAILRAVQTLLPAFAGERPTPCHRDYCPANWLVTTEGTWAGVIDFEFAYWDVRAADFARYPQWEWVHRPDLIEAFCEGYDRRLIPPAEQLLAARALYALGAIVWGAENSYHGFEADGRQALQHLGKLI